MSDCLCRRPTYETDARCPVHGHSPEDRQCPYVFTKRGWDGTRCKRLIHDNDEHWTRRWL